MRTSEGKSAEILRKLKIFPSTIVCRHTTPGHPGVTLDTSSALRDVGEVAATPTTDPAMVITTSLRYQGAPGDLPTAARCPDLLPQLTVLLQEGDGTTPAPCPGDASESSL